MSHACHPGFVPGYPFGPQGKDGGDPTLARHTIALQIDDPSPATAGAPQAPAVFHFLPENLHLHKTRADRVAPPGMGLFLKIRVHSLAQGDGRGHWTGEAMET